MTESLPHTPLLRKYSQSNPCHRPLLAALSWCHGHWMKSPGKLVLSAAAATMACAEAAELRFRSFTRLVLPQNLGQFYSVQNFTHFFDKGSEEYTEALLNFGFLQGVDEILNMSDEQFQSFSPHDTDPTQIAGREQYQLFWRAYVGPWKSEATLEDIEKRETLAELSPFKSAPSHWLANWSQQHLMAFRNLPQPTDQSRYGYMATLVSKLMMAPPIKAEDVNHVATAKEALHTQTEMCNLIACYTTSLEESHRMRTCLGGGCRHSNCPPGISDLQPSAACKRSLDCLNNLRVKKQRTTPGGPLGSPGESACCGACVRYHLCSERENDIKEAGCGDAFPLVTGVQDGTDAIRDRWAALGFEARWEHDNNKGHSAPCANIPFGYGQPALSDTYPHPKEAHVPVSGHTFYSAKDTAVWNIDQVYKAIYQYEERADALIKRTEDAALFALANAPFYWATEGEARLSALIVANEEKYVRVRQPAETFVRRTLRVRRAQIAAERALAQQTVMPQDAAGWALVQAGTSLDEPMAQV